MEDYIKDFLRVIRDCSVDNTYKMAWAKGIVEIASESNSPIIYLSDIAGKMFKYYWDQTIFFDLCQGSSINKRPEFITEVKKQIDNYFFDKVEKQPIRFDRIKEKIKLNKKKLIRILKQDVSWRFLKLKGKEIPLYEYKRGNDFLILHNHLIVKEYSEVLYEAINFRWTQILENYNSSPRIAKKVRIIDFGKVKRKNLSKFKLFLDLENPEHICFICNKKIENEKPSIDHVIPWSFLFSDDIWNLVYVHKKCNSQKSNIIPSEKDIERLEKRNLSMLEKLKGMKKLSTKKEVRELEIAIEKDYVKKFWIGCRT